MNGFLRVFLAAGALAATTDALAGSGTFGPKTMRVEMPNREVDRPILMPKGWVELALGYDYKRGVGAWTADGERHLWESARWNLHTQTATARYGIAPHVELWASLPFKEGLLVNEPRGVRTSDWSIGDFKLGGRWEIWGEDDPQAQVALESWYKGPSGNETPGSYIGGPLNVTRFVFTTGTPDLYLGVAAKKTFGPLAVGGRVGYTKRFSQLVQYLVELETLQFLGRIKPGDMFTAEASVLGQAGPVALEVVPRFGARGTTAIGTTSPGLNASKNLEDVVGSSGWTLDVDGRLYLNITRGFDVIAWASVPVRGEDLQFFPIEDIHPTLGTTVGGVVEVRY